MRIKSLSISRRTKLDTMFYTSLYCTGVYMYSLLVYAYIIYDAYFTIIFYIYLYVIGTLYYRLITYGINFYYDQYVRELHQVELYHYKL